MSEAEAKIPLKLGKDQLVSLSVGALGAVMTTVAVLASGWGSGEEKIRAHGATIAEIKETQRSEFDLLRKDIRQIGEDVKEINRYLRKFSPDP